MAMSLDRQQMLFKMRNGIPLHTEEVDYKYTCKVCGKKCQNMSRMLAHSKECKSAAIRDTNKA